MNGFEDIIKQLETQKAAIERALEALRMVGGGAAESADAPKVIADERPPSVPKAKKGAKQAVKATPEKRRMTPEGRQKLAEAMKRRWATKRTAGQAKKRPGRPKKAAPTT